MLERPSRDFRADPETAALSAIPMHDVQELVAGGSLAHIRLNDQVYTLRITRQGKLILTK